MKWNRLAAVAVVALAFPTAGASAQETGGPPPIDPYTQAQCAAMPVSALGLRPAHTNPASSPCATAHNHVLKLVQGSPQPLLGTVFPTTVTAGAITGDTERGAGFARASASVADASVKFPGLSLQASVLHSEARSDSAGFCSSGIPSSLSRVGTLTVNGKRYDVGERSFAIPVLGLGTVNVNQKVVDGGFVLRRAIYVDLHGSSLDVVIAESKAAIGCSPAP